MTFPLMEDPGLSGIDIKNLSLNPVTLRRQCGVPVLSLFLKITALFSFSLMLRAVRTESAGFSVRPAKVHLHTLLSMRTQPYQHRLKYLHTMLNQYFSQHCTGKPL